MFEKKKVFTVPTATAGALLGRRTETDMAKAAEKKKAKTGPRGAGTKKKAVPRGAGTKKKAGPVLLAGNRALSIPQADEAAAAGEGPIGVGTVLTGPDGTTYMVTAVDGTGSVVFGRYNSAAPDPGPDPGPLGDTAEVLKGVGTDGPDGTESSYYHAHLARIRDDPLPELTGDDILSCLQGV